MKIWFFASFILFCLFITFYTRKRQRTDEKKESEFWEKEHRANLSRRKPVDRLPYISLPMDRLPLSVLTDDEEIRDILETVEQLNQSRILNLTGISNTDLKLKYGVANLNFLTDCDQNYTLLVRTLQKWASLLIKNGYPEEARCVLEFAVETGTDVSSTYYDLAKLYRDSGEPEKINSLIETASSLNSMMKNSIVRTLKEFDPYNGSSRS